MATIAAVATWPDNAVLIQPKTLELAVGILMVPAGTWAFVSFILVIGFRRDQMPRIRELPRPSWRQVGVFIVGALCIAAVIGIGVALGSAKGSTRILSGGVHQVSTAGLADSAWTTVSLHDFQLWQARFLRLDAAFAFFGLGIVALCALMSNLRHQLIKRDSSS